MAKVRSYSREFLKLLFASILTAVVTITLASALSGANNALVKRVDHNASVAADEILQTRRLICVIAEENTAIEWSRVRDICTNLVPR